MWEGNANKPAYGDGAAWETPHPVACELSVAGGRALAGWAYPGFMRPEITDPAVRAIAEEIAADPANASFTKRGVGPLFYAGSQCRIMIVGQAPG